MISLYLHLPFCLSKCPYCDFASYDNRENKIDDYINALDIELKYYRDNFNIDYKTLFIGGGTPSSLNTKQLDKLFYTISKYILCNKIEESTIEINPETLDEEKIGIFKKAGISRVSVGAQSFDNSCLKILGRVHNAEKIMQSIKIIKDSGDFDINIDLIYGIPGQDTEGVLSDIKKAVDLKPRHISFYGLTNYEETGFAGYLKSKNLTMPGDEISEEMYMKGCEALEHGGYKQYEISNFAAPRKECVHNLNYWGPGEYVGVGVSASSYFNGSRYKNISDISEYIKIMKENSDPATESEKATEDIILKDYIMLKLRLCAGINLNDFSKKFGYDFETRYSKIIDKFEKQGFINIGKDNICLTRKGFLLSNSIMVEFI